MPPPLKKKSLHVAVDLFLKVALLSDKIRPRSGLSTLLMEVLVILDNTFNSVYATTQFFPDFFICLKVMDALLASFHFAHHLP